MPGIILTPESELHFTLSASEETAKCTMTLRHPGGTDEYYAFKVCGRRCQYRIYERVNSMRIAVL